MVARLLFVLSLALGTFCGRAQENRGQELIRKGLLRAQGTISPAVALSGGERNIYLHGDLDYYVSPRVSIRGDSYYFLGVPRGRLVQLNHGVFFGALYHFPGGRFDPYIGLQPGVGYAAADEPSGPDSTLPVMPRQSEPTIVPYISAAAGFNFFVWKHIHFQMMLRYVNGRHPAPWGNVPLDDLRFSMGVGWNVNLIKANK